MIETITYIVNPKATLYPEKDVNPRDRILRGFNWHGYNRPKKIADIFIWNTNNETEQDSSE